MRSTVIIYLVLLAIADALIPVPILALILIWVAVKKPAWFTDLVQKVYAEP